MSIIHQPILEVNLKYLQENYRIAEKNAHGAKVSAVVKADAYGLGATYVVDCLHNAGCRDFFVATLEEALEIRNLFSDCNIYVLAGVFKNEEEAFENFSITPVINNEYQANIWKNYAKNRNTPLDAIIHVDTGMNRLGFSRKESLHFYKNFSNYDLLKIKYIMSHLSCAEDAEHFMNTRQLIRFNKISAFVPSIKRSLANSSGIFLGKDYCFDMVRPGAALYGINPTPYQANPMKCVAFLKAPIIQVRDIEEDGYIGYGATCTIQDSRTIATIAIGYADGYPRDLSNYGRAYIHGYYANILGRISMDFLVLDVTHIPKKFLHLGESVELIGKHITADEVAEKIGTISYEVLCGIGKRVKRVYTR